MPRILTVVGARPQFVKAAAVTPALVDAGIEESIVHTGQHHDYLMSQTFFEDLELPSPDHHLGIHGGGHGEMTARMMTALEPVLLDSHADAVLVYGDTNSTLAGAVTAAQLTIPVIHVEAGLRSFRLSQPEELNRRVTDRLSSLLLCPTQAAVGNLATEGICQSVLHVGDVMLDTFVSSEHARAGPASCLEPYGIEVGAYRLATVHREENTSSPGALRRVISYIQEAARDLPLVLPLHPRTREALDRMNVDTTGLILIEPVGYFEMMRLVRDAVEVLTDSGGLQKEAYFNRVPCVTLRDETEWTETITNGWNRLWSEPSYLSRREIPDYGNGHAATLIAAAMAEWLGNSVPAWVSPTPS